MQRPLQKGFTLIELLVVIAIIAVLAAILFPVFARARENARRASCMSNLKQIGLGIMQYVQDYDEKYPYDHYAIEGSGVSSTNVTNGVFGYNSFAPQWGYRWPARIMPYLKSKQIFQCPSATALDSSATTAEAANNVMSYWSAGAFFARPGENAVSMASIQSPSQAPMLYDAFDGVFRAAIVFRPYFNPANSPVIYDPTTSLSTARPGTHFDGMNALYADGHVKWLHKQALIDQVKIDPGIS